MHQSRLIGRSLAALLLLALTAAAGLAAPRAQAQGQRCFPETGQCVSGRFLSYWEQQGGLAVFGYPVSAAVEERNRDTGATYLTQWFERARFELHAENAAPYDVLLGRLGDDLLVKAGIDWRSLPPASGPQAGCRWFAETGHNVCNQGGALGFKRYWEAHGLEFDGQRGASPAESLALFGLPLSEPRLETNSSGDTVLTQWFERARFEWHPGNPDQFKVLLGLLGNDARIPIVRRQHPGMPGRLIIYESDTLYEASADGSRIRRLSTLGGGAFGISRDGRFLASAAEGVCGAARLCVKDLASGGTTVIHYDSSASGFAWSPDSAKLAYVSGQEGRRGLYVYDLAAATETLLAPGRAEAMPAYASWAPDSRRLVFSMIYGEDGIFTINADGSGRQRLVEHGAHPNWSPDGARIAYQAPAFANHTIAVIELATGREIRLPGAPNGAPSWSPDGARLAYSVTPPQEPGPAQRQVLQVIGADGGGLVTVIEQPAGRFLAGGPWSPDGAYVSALISCSRLCGPAQVLAAPAGGGTVLTLLGTELGVGFGVTPVAWLP